MNTVDSRVEVRAMPIVTSTTASPPPLSGRLVVVIRSVIEEATLAGRILEAAGRGGRAVLLLGIDAGFIQETELRRSMALLAAFLRNAGTEAEIRIEHGQDWLPRLSTYVGREDLLACCLEGDPAGLGTPLHDVLSGHSRLPVLVFAGAGAWQEEPKGILRGLAPWLASLAVILGFLWLQIWLTQLGGGAQATSLLVLTLPVEVGLIWLCNALLD